MYSHQTWGDYIRNVIDYDYLAHARLRLNKITMYSITITFESNLDYNCDYIYFETFSEKNTNPFAWFRISIISDNIRYE